MMHAKIVEDAGEKDHEYCNREATSNVLACYGALGMFVVLR
jgi:hypothetical protein